MLRVFFEIFREAGPPAREGSGAFGPAAAAGAGPLHELERAAAEPEAPSAREGPRRRAERASLFGSSRQSLQRLADGGPPASRLDGPKGGSVPKGDAYAAVSSKDP